MNLEYLEASLKEIRHLLSHLHSEVTTLEVGTQGILRILQDFEGTAAHDELTGLLRRGPFFRKWKELLAECERLDQNCGLLLLDIDYFKKINDQHGHPTGDEVLKRVSQLLKQFESPHCIVGRYGGEEFAIAYQGKDAEILGLAEMIRRGAEKLHGPVIDSEGKPQANVQWKCTVSVGIASTQSSSIGSSRDVTRLLAAADKALYEAKKKGRNQVRAA